jgi:hypothetical protein
VAVGGEGGEAAGEDEGQVRGARVEVRGVWCEEGGGGGGEGAAEVGAAEVFGAGGGGGVDGDGGEGAGGESGEEGGRVEGGVDGVAGLSVGEGEVEGVAGGDARAGAGEGDAGGGVVAEGGVGGGEWGHVWRGVGHREMVRARVGGARRAPIAGLLRWMLTTGQKQCSALGYAPLPGEVVKEELGVVEGMR